MNIAKVEMCPVCGGKGKITRTKKAQKVDLVLFAAEKLRKYGFTYRESAKALGYKNPGSIQTLLKKRRKTNV